MIGRAAASLRLRAADAADGLLGRRDELIPPRRLADYVGDTDFRITGEEFLGHFRDLADLRADDRVLEIGCGIGRMARVLVPVLRPPGSYDGFDIVQTGISWCREHYRRAPAPFRFRHADLHNALYNPGAAGRPEEYRFPYADTGFDLVIATSVFTHLLAPAAERYLAEAARVLAPGGRIFSTWFLLGGEPGRPPAPFQRSAQTAPAAVADVSVPESAVAYEERWLQARAAAHGLGPPQIHPGSWSGGAGISRQDIVVLRRA